MNRATGLLGFSRTADGGREIGAANLSLPFSADRQKHEIPISVALKAIRDRDGLFCTPAGGYFVYSGFFQLSSFSTLSMQEAMEFEI